MIADNSTTGKTERLLRLYEVEARVALRRSQIYSLELRGEFPRRVKLGRRASAWIESEVSAWIADRIAERDARHAA